LLLLAAVEYSVAAVTAPEYEAKTELCATVSKSLSLEFFRPRGLGGVCSRQSRCV
jgi:hypothetical protein